MRRSCRSSAEKLSELTEVELKLLCRSFGTCLEWVSGHKMKCRAASRVVFSEMTRGVRPACSASLLINLIINF